jgi:hypothetical protein
VIPRGDVFTVRPVLIISFLMSMLIIGWFASVQLGVLTGGGVSGAQAVTGSQSPGSSEPSPSSPVDRAMAVSNMADERQREMEESLKHH